MTSPPYWGLRDYGTAQWEGGEEGCEHYPPARKPGEAKASTLGGGKTVIYAQEIGVNAYRNVCGKCGARRIDSQLGLEETPAEYIEKMVAVFREVWRVLRDDGTLWLNLGDSYAGHNLPGWRDGNEAKNGGVSNKNGVGYVLGLKPKDLCGIPWRIAFALQANGWFLRSDIIWHKPNQMPESVTDRPTKSHEYIFLLTKQERYYYDADAIREPHVRLWDSSNGGNLSPNGNHKANGLIRERGCEYPLPNPMGRNKRSVWTIATQPYAEAHFATFPEEIPKLCILAGSKPGDTILDPFAGSGTVGKVALELGRRAILIELNPDYVELAEERTQVTFGFF